MSPFFTGPLFWLLVCIEQFIAWLIDWGFSGTFLQTSFILYIVLLRIDHEVHGRAKQLIANLFNRN